MNLLTSPLRRLAVAALCASVGATTFGTVAMLADSSNSVYDPSTGSVSGSVPFQWTVADNLSIACSQNGTKVTMALDASGNGSVNLSLKVAFANPSVDWVDGEWVKHNGTTTTKVYSGDGNLTEVTLTPTVTGGAASKTTQSVTGNPYVYYFGTPNPGNGASGTPTWNALGHCNQGKGNATLPFHNWTVDWSAQTSGRVKRGACFTNNNYSEAALNQIVGVLSISQSDATKILYSNKTVSTSPYGENYVRLISGSSAYDLYVGGESGVFDWAGYHVWWGPLSANATSGPITLNKDYPKSAVQGIGGNPGVWLGIGTPNDTSNDYHYLGRCNKL